jgi:hypothetical protein
MVKLSAADFPRYRCRSSPIGGATGGQGGAAGRSTCWVEGTILPVRSSEKFHYSSLAVISRYGLMLALLAFSLTLFNESSPTTYFSYLRHPPGSFLVYISWGVCAFIFITRTPAFFRAVGRVPAVEFDGRHLLVRGWETVVFDLEADPSITYRVDDGRGRVVITSETGKSAVVPLGQIDGPRSLIRFLEEVTASARAVGSA